MGDHWFWWMLTLAVIGWYSTITILVAVRGSMDIRLMLTRLRQHGASGDDRPESTE